MKSLRILLAFAAGPAAAGPADVVGATATAAPGGVRFDVSVAHADEGWEHYADAWRVLAPDGAVLGVRELLHPHVDEQPFTRSLVVAIPSGVREVRVEARDSLHGWGGAAMTVALPDR